MQSRSAIGTLFALSTLVCACSGGSGTSVAPVPGQAAGPATIDVSASTDSHAYTIVLQTNASASFLQNGYAADTTVSPSDAATFFRDLAEHAPISSVPTENGCVKSSSFGTTTTLVYEGSTSGDVSCPPANPSPAETLYQDASKIENDVMTNIGPFNH